MKQSDYPSTQEILREHRKKRRTYTILIICVACLPLVIGTIIGLTSDTPQAYADVQPAEVVDPTLDSAARAEEAASRQLRMDSIQRVINRLVSRCLVTHDEFKDVTFYKHKTVGKYYPNRKTIYAECNSEGYFYLRSNYHANDWIFHESVQVKIGDDVLTSGVVPSYDENNRQDNDAGSVWENVTYGDLGKAIITRIAAKPEARVVVRFQGRQYHDDVTLSAADKNAIKEVYDLARSIGEMRYYESNLEL